MALTYRERAEYIRQRKLEYTGQKIKQRNDMDTDDDGALPMSDDFRFIPLANDSDGGFYGYVAQSVNFTRLLDVYPLYVDPVELIAGRRMPKLIRYIGDGEWPTKWPHHIASYEHLIEKQELYGITPGIGSSQHYACDYDMGIRLGFTGLLDKIRSFREMHGPDRREFYDAEERVLLAILRLIQRHVDYMAFLLSVEKEEQNRQNLLEMLDCNQALLKRPPETFLEVCQWYAWFSQMGWSFNDLAAGVQIDRFLYPFYKRDMEAGILDDEKATFILTNLLVLNPDYFQLAGPDIHGNDMSNEVSFLVLRAAHWLNSTANITIRLHDRIDPRLFEAGVRYLFEDGNGWPRFSGDKGLMNYVKNRGIDRQAAIDRIALGCNWMALPGREYPLNDCVKINVAHIFDRCFHEVAYKEAPSVQKLWDRFLCCLTEAVQVTAEGIAFHLEHMHKVFPELVGNLLMHNTIEQGLDVTQAAEFINIGVDGCGLAIAADSFAALEQRIERESLLSWNQVTAAIDRNFSGPEHERVQLILKSSGRYCQGASLGDKWADRINREFTRRVVDTKLPGNAIMIPGWFSWAFMAELGRNIGATPDGRKAGMPITQGANPNNNFRRDGAATAMSNGIAMVQPGYGNPAPMQLELDPGLKAEEGGIKRVMALLKGHADLGGTLINVNILNRERILDANRHPENYPELVVRVTGFTAYFAALSPQMRQLVVDRMVESV